MPNRDAHRHLMRELARLGCAPDRAEFHRQRIWRRRAALYEADPALWRRMRAANRAARAALRGAAAAAEPTPAPAAFPCVPEWRPEVARVFASEEPVRYEPPPEPEPVAEAREQFWMRFVYNSDVANTDWLRGDGDEPSDF